MADQQIVSVLIGGLVTLAGTLAVQLFVVPYVQARTRGRERWEKDVMTLAALLEEELPRALDSLRWTGFEVRHLWLLEGTEGFTPEVVRNLVQQVEPKYREADRVVGQEMARLRLLIDRVKRINRNAPLWRELDFGRVELQGGLFTFDVLKLKSRDIVEMSDQEWDEGWDRVEEARQRLLDVVNEVADPVPMKPPPQYTLRRWRKKIRRIIEQGLRPLSRVAAKLIRTDG